MKRLAFAIPVVLAVVLGLAFAGVISIPGIGAKKAKAAPQAAPATTPKPVATTPKHFPKPPPPVVAVHPTPPDDPEQGAAALATIWNGISAARIEAIAKDWKDEELARVLAHMEDDKVAEFLSSIQDVGRASKLSRILRDRASKPRKDETKAP